MKATPKWLLIPPVVAALLILGPLSMQSPPPPAPNERTPAVEPAKPPSSEDAGRAGRANPALPRTPDLWQMSSALIGVLLLGACGLLLLRRLRGGQTPARGAKLVTLRQTLRLSARQAIHVIEFDDRILLVGEHERGLVLLESGKAQPGVDETEVLARNAAQLATADAEGQDDGAVPRNLVIPRPEPRPKRRLPTPPSIVPATRTSHGLNDFRALLQKVGRA